MFYGAEVFNQDIGRDMTNVTDMSSMFQGAESFNHDMVIGHSRVTNMSAMFDGASAFNHDIGDWDTGVTTCSLFRDAASFNRTSVAGHDYDEHGPMFRSALQFNQDLSLWCGASPPRRST